MPAKTSPQYARLESHEPPPVSFSNTLPSESHYTFSHSSALDPGPTPKEATTGTYSREPPPVPDHAVAQWHTKWLHKATLLSLAVLYLGLAGSLIGLWLSNKHQEGFTTALSKNHYSWTYGPTAILVIFLSFWRQVDYYAKLIQPWQVLATEVPVPATRSVLLDYVSPLQITSFWRALKNRHIPVAASVAGFAILKLVILASTGLLVLTPVPASLSVDVAVSTKFSMDRVQRETFEGAVDDAPVQAYLGAVTNEMPYPPGTLDDRAFQRIEWPKQDINNLKVPLEVFVPKIKCEVAEINTRKYLDPGTLYVELDAPSCSVGHEDQDDMTLDGRQQNGRLRATGSEEPAFFTYYDLWRVNCSGPDVTTSVSSIDNSTQADIRHAMVVSNVSAWTRPSGTSGTITDQTAFDLSAVICDVDYGVGRLEMLHNLVDGTINATASADADSSHLDGLSGVMLGEQIFTSLQKAVSISFPDDDSRFHFASVPLFWTMLQALDEPLEALLDPKVLQSSAERVWNGLAAQVFWQAYEEPTEEIVAGQALHEEEKLRIGTVSLWVMIGGFSVLAVLSVILAFTVQRGVVAHDPRLIVPLDCVPFRGAGALRTSQLVDHLQAWTFRTDKGRLIATGGGDAPEVRIKNKAWTPFSTKYWMIGLMLVSPLVVIVVLEILQRLSDANQGIADVNGDVPGYLSHYLSAGLMLLLATCVNNFDFTITSFAPYSILRLGAASASRSIDFTLLGELAPVALAKSLRARHLSSTFSNVAAVVGSILTIVVSGLWTIDHDVMLVDDVSVSVSSWNVSWPNSSIEDGGAARVFDQIQHGAAAEPARIYEDLVFPELNSPGNSSLSIPVVRPSLECSIATDDEIEIEFFTDSDEHEWLRLRVLPALPERCRGGVDATNSYANFSTLIEYYDFYAGHWTGLFVDVHMGPWPESNTTGEAGEAIPPDPLQPDNPPGCPSLGMIFATNNGENTTKADVAGLLCSQKLETVYVQAPYSDGVLLKSTPPEILNSSTLIDAAPFRVQPHIREWSKFAGNNTDESNASPFFNHLLYGPDAPDVEDLLTNRVAFVDAASRLYSRYMAHVVDLHFRREEQEGEDTVAGTRTTRKARLRMNSGSKIALQVMLGVISVLAAVAFAASDIRGTLPRGPYSIASVAALVEGWEGRRERGELYSLGWWCGKEREMMEWRGGIGEAGESSGAALGKRRFGVDVGMPEDLGYRKTGWLEMRRRVTGRVI